MPEQQILANWYLLIYVAIISFILFYLLRDF